MIFKIAATSVIAVLTTCGMAQSTSFATPPGTLPAAMAYGQFFSPSAPREAASNPNSREDELYRQGNDALSNGEWQAGMEAFNKVETLHGRRADAALYWRAFALNKLGRRPEALNALAEMRRRFPRTTWLKDAGALEVEIRQQSGQRVSPESENDEDLKLLALNSLMNSNEERAIPLLEGIVRSNHSQKLKDRALFILAQSDSVRARQLLMGIARDHANPELQAKAIQYIGLNSSHESGSALAEIYGQTSDARIKKAVLGAFMTSADANGLLEVIRHEQHPELRRHAIEQLGAMDATSALNTLYHSSSSFEDKESIIHAMAISSDVSGLSEILRSDQDARVRIAAIKSLGITDSKKSRPLLTAMYDQDRSEEVRKAVIEALFIQDDVHDLVSMARKEKDPAMRRSLIEKLSIMDSKESRDFMMEIINK